MADITDLIQPDSRVPIRAASTSDKVIDDLPWILGKLSDRLMGDGALLTLHVSDGRPVETVCMIGLDANMRFERVTASIAREFCFTSPRARSAAPLFHWHPVTDVGGNKAGEFLSFVAVDDGAICLMASVYFHHNNFLQRFAAEKIAERYAPVLSGYFRLWMHARNQQRQIDALQSALDVPASAVYVLSAGGDLLYENGEGKALLDKGVVLRRSRTTLTAAAMSDSMQLQVAIQHAQHSANDGETPLVRVGGRKGERALIALVVRVRKIPETDADPSVVICVFDPNRDIKPMMRPVCDLYGLSRTESRLVELIVSGETISESAKMMRIAEQTARSYLKNIFLKTDTNRQSDLVRAILRDVANCAARSFITPQKIDAKRNSAGG